MHGTNIDPLNRVRPCSARVTPQSSEAERTTRSPVVAAFVTDQTRTNNPNKTRHVKMESVCECA